jgi:hypothetical protein
MFLIIIIYNLNYLFLSNPISGLFPESYSYHVYMQYDMRMRVCLEYASQFIGCI